MFGEEILHLIGTLKVGVINLFILFPSDFLSSTPCELLFPELFLGSPQRIVDPSLELSSD
jgi:hypothetical protein